jgi:hypothetical protein
LALLCVRSQKVLSSGETHDFLVEGSLKSVYGADDTDTDTELGETEQEAAGGAHNVNGSSSSSDSDVTVRSSRSVSSGGTEGRPKRPARRARHRLLGARVVTLRPGDCLLVPAGLYHDVQANDTGPALSITLRFACSPFDCPCGRASAAPCVRPLGHWGAHVSGSGGACSHNGSNGGGVADDGGAAGGSGSKGKGAIEVCPPAALDNATDAKTSTGAMFRRWRESTEISSSTENGSTGSSGSPKISSTGSSDGTSIILVTSGGSASDSGQRQMFSKWRHLSKPCIAVNAAAQSVVPSSAATASAAAKTPGALFQRWKKETGNDNSFRSGIGPAPANAEAETPLAQGETPPLGFAQDIYANSAPPFVVVPADHGPVVSSALAAVATAAASTTAAAQMNEYRTDFDVDE